MSVSFIKHHDTVSIASPFTIPRETEKIKTCFPVLMDKTTNFSIRLVAWCEAMDLVAIIVVPNTLQIRHGLNGQILFSMQFEGEDITCLCWRPDGKVVAVSQTNICSLVIVETGKILTKITKPGTIFNVWIHDTINKQIPPLPTETLFAEFASDPLTVKRVYKPCANPVLDQFGRSRIDFLVSNCFDGKIHFDAYGTINVAILDVAQLLSFSCDKKVLPVHTEFISDLSYIFLGYCVIEGDVQTLEYAFLSNKILQKRYEISMYCHYVQCFEKITTAVEKIWKDFALKWDNAYKPAVRKFSLLSDSLSEKLENSTPEQEFIAYLATGVPSSAMLSFLSYFAPTPLLNLQNSIILTLNEMDLSAIIKLIEKGLYILSKLVELHVGTGQIENWTLVADLWGKLIPILSLAQETLSQTKRNFIAFFHFMNESIEKYGEESLAAKRQAQLSGEILPYRPFKSIDTKSISNCILLDLFQNRTGKLFLDSSSFVSNFNNISHEFSACKIEKSKCISKAFQLLSNYSLFQYSKNDSTFKTPRFWLPESLLVNSAANVADKSTTDIKISNTKEEKSSIVGLMSFLKPDEEMDVYDTSMVDVSMDKSILSRRISLGSFEVGAKSYFGSFCSPELFISNFNVGTSELLVGVVIFCTKKSCGFEGPVLYLCKFDTNSGTSVVSLSNLNICLDYVITSVSFLSENEIGIVYGKLSDKEFTVSSILIDEISFYPMNSVLSALTSSNAFITQVVANGVIPLQQISFQYSHSLDFIPFNLSTSMSRKLGSVVGKKRWLIFDLVVDNAEEVELMDDTNISIINSLTPNKNKTDFKDSSSSTSISTDASLLRRSERSNSVEFDKENMSFGVNSNLVV